MDIVSRIKQTATQGIQQLYDANMPEEQLIVNLTKKEFEGDYTLVVFPVVKLAKKKPEQVGEELGVYFQEALPELESFNVIKGFLNLQFTPAYWLQFLQDELANDTFGKQPATGRTIVLEYCGPNTNKPLHLGHIRNMLLGYSVAGILSWNGHDVHKVNIYNDRGIAICKSMAAWLENGKGETPESSGIKGDHLVGKYYVEYSNILKPQMKPYLDEGMEPREAEKQTGIFKKAQDMLVQWEAGDEEVMELWRTMNGWVYQGFNQTFERLGVDFEKDYFESDTYTYGKKIVEEGLENGAYYRRDDGSVWVDLTDEGLDEKLLLRKDGTSVYLTQDLGTAQLRYEDFKMDQSIYVVANEQDYHFQVLKLTLQKLGKPYADGIYHLSYGLVELPHGRMKSREGTVVDADDLINEMVAAAKKQAEERGKIEDLQSDEAKKLFDIVGLGALKYFMLRVDPKKKMLFNPEESIDLQGQTATFIQYSYTRIRSVLRQVNDQFGDISTDMELHDAEKDLLFQLHLFPAAVQEAGAEYNPSVVTAYLYELAKSFNRFYTECSILNEEDESRRNLRLALASFTAKNIRNGFKLLGIDVPERM